MKVSMKNWILLALLVSGCSLNTAEEKPSTGIDAKIAAENAGIKVESLNKNASSLSVGELKNLAKNLDDHGWAIIDRIRNNTEFPVDVFFYKTLHDLLPPGTVVRIKSLKSDYAVLAAKEEDFQNKNLDENADLSPAETNLIEIDLAPSAEIKSKKKLSLSDFDASGKLKKTGNSEGVGKTEIPEKIIEKKIVEEVVPKNFRYLAARNLSGAFHLKADTTDPLDPATRFVVRKMIDSNLNTYLGFESEVAAGKMLRTKKNNEIVFLDTSTLDELVNIGQQSKDNFSSEFDSDAHWLLYSKGVDPSKPIDVTAGRYLLSCNLKNRKMDAFVSVRGSADQASQVFYKKPACYWYWTEGAGEFLNLHSGTVGKRGGWLGNTAPTYDKKYRYWFNSYAMRTALSPSKLIPLSGNAMSFEAVCSADLNEQVDFGKVENRVGLGDEVGRPETEGEDWGKLGKSERDSARELFSSVKRGFDQNNFSKLEEGLAIINHAREYEYGSKRSSYSVQGGSLLGFWDKLVGWSGNSNNLCRRVANRKTEIRYGDKIKLVSTGSYFTLCAAGEDAVFGSHDDTDSELEKLAALKANFSEISNATPSEVAWFYIKGPHAKGDRWNCKIGAPVQDGDVIRLEHFATGRNLMIARGKNPAKGQLYYGPALSDGRDWSYKGSPELVSVLPLSKDVAKIKYDVSKGDVSKKPLEHEFLVTLSSSRDGAGTSDDNFVVKFSDPVSPNLVLGQTFSLVHQNSKHNLWSQHVLFNQLKGRSFGLITGLFLENNEDALSSQWFVMCSESEGSPVKDVAWVGLPDGAPQRDVGDSEELAIEIVELGLGGKLGPGETLSVKLPVYKKDPKVSGYAKDVIANFDVEKIVELSPLLGRGVAWLEESLSVPNKAAIFFKAKCQDAGDIQIYLGSKIGLDFIWKVVIGGGGNTSSYILKKDYPGGVAVEKKVTEVFKAKNPLAGAIPGQYISYWLSIDDGLIMLGVGQNIGENIVLAWRDLEQREPVSRVGFGSGEKSVSFAEVKVTDPMNIKPPKNFYFNQTSPLSVDEERLLKFDSSRGKQSLVLKVPGNGSMAFNLQGKSGALYFYEDESNKIFDSSLSGDARKKRIKDSLVINLRTKLENLKGMLGLSKIFDSANNKFDSLGVNDSSVGALEQEALVLKQDIISLFRQRPDSVLNKFFDSLNEKEQEDFKVYKSLMNDLVADLKSLSVGALKDGIALLVKRFLQEKLKDEINKSSDTFKNDFLDAVLGRKVIPQTVDEASKSDINPWNWVLDSVVEDAQKNVSGVNDHYRVRFQSYSEVLNKRKEIEQKIVKVLQSYAQDVVGALLKKDSFALDLVNDILVGSKKKFLDLLKTNSLSSLNVEEINDRFRASIELIADKKIGFDELFKKMFPDQLITYFFQSMSITGEACVVLEKYSSATKEYEILVSSKDQDVIGLDIAAAQGKDFWLSFNKGRFFLGQGSVIGENLFLYHWDLVHPCEDISLIGFIANQANLSKLKIGNTVKLSLREQAADYVIQKKVFDYKGSLQILSPYEYQLSQDDQQVKFADKISRKTLFPGKTPQRGALYYFTLIIEPNGFPDLQWTKEPENKIKLEIEKHAAMLQANTDALMQAAMNVQGQGAIGGIIGAGASLLYSGIGVGLATEAGQLNALNQTAFRANDSYVFTDNMATMAKLASDSIPPAAQANRIKVDEQLALGAKWTASDLDKLQRLLPLYDNVVNLVTHPYVIVGSKDQLFSGIGSLYKAHKLLYAQAKTVESTHFDLLSLLIKAYNNPYLFDPNVKADLKLKETWYSYINEIARKIISIDQEKGITIPGCFGEYIWLADKFKTPNKGSVSFLAKASNDVFVCFSENQFNVRNSDSDIYEIVFGAWENSKTVIRAKSLDKAVAQTTNQDALVNPVDYKKFWVSFNNGRIILGTGELDPANAIGVYNSETREITTPEWNNYSYDVTVNSEWLKHAIGDFKGYEGKDLLLKRLAKTKDAAKKKQIQSQIDDRTEKLSALFDKKQYAYQTAATAQGFYNVEPFMWQDSYFDPKKTKIDKVGLSSWNSEVSFQQIKVSVCVEEVDLYIKNLYAQINNKNNQPIFDEDASLDSYRSKVLASLQLDETDVAPAVQKIDRPSESKSEVSLEVQTNDVDMESQKEASDESDVKSDKEVLVKDEKKIKTEDKSVVEAKGSDQTDASVVQEEELENVNDVEIVKEDSVAPSKDEKKIATEDESVVEDKGLNQTDASVVQEEDEVVYLEEPEVSAEEKVVDQ